MTIDPNNWPLTTYNWPQDNWSPKTDPSQLTSNNCPVIIDPNKWPPNNWPLTIIDPGVPEALWNFQKYSGGPECHQNLKNRTEPNSSLFHHYGLIKDHLFYMLFFLCYRYRTQSLASVASLWDKRSLALCSLKNHVWS